MSGQIGYLVKRMTANIKTSVIGKFKAVVNDSIKALTRTHLSGLSQRSQRAQVNEIKRRIFFPYRPQPNPPIALTAQANELVVFHREGFKLGPNVALNKLYIKTHENLYPDFIVHYTRCLQRMLELSSNFPEVPLKMRSSTPIFSPGQRASVSMDKKNFYYILRNYLNDGNQLPAEYIDNNNVRRATPALPSHIRHYTPEIFGQHLRALFDLDSVIRGPSKSFESKGVVLTTNGVSASVHYTPTTNEDESDDESEEEILNGIIQLSLTPPEEEDDDDDVSMEDIDDDMDDDEEDGDSTAVRHIVYVFDPGRVSIITAIGYDSRTNAIVTRTKLTRAQYYNDAKIDACHQRSNIWNLSSKRLIEGMAQHNFRTTDPATFRDSIRYYLGHHDQIWYIFGKRKKKYRQRVFLDGKKKQTVSRFLASLNIPSIELNGQHIDFDGPPVIYYGDGAFPSGGRGERSVPTKWFKKACKQFYRCYAVDEFRTSQVCPTCEDQRVYKVYKRFSDGMKEIRGLRWCDACKRLWDRDMMACENMNKKRLGGYNEILDRPTATEGIRWDEPQAVFVYRRNTPPRN